MMLKDFTTTGAGVGWCGICKHQNTVPRALESTQEMSYISCNCPLTAKTLI